MCEPLGMWQHLVTLRAGRESRPRAVAERQRPLAGLRRGQLESGGCSADRSRGRCPQKTKGGKQPWYQAPQLSSTEGRSWAENLHKAEGPLGLCYAGGTMWKGHGEAVGPAWICG